MSDPLLDTNIVIDWLRQKQPAFIEMTLYAGHRISRITWAEVLAGEPQQTRDTVIHLLRRFTVIEVDAEIAANAAELRYRTRIKLLDALIYATAQVHDAILVTRNTKDFPADMPGVRIPYTL